MPTDPTLAAFNKRVDRFRKEMTPQALDHALGKMAKDEATKAAEGDWTNADFSGWTRAKPIKMATRYDVLSPGRVLLKPTPRSAGPWTVAESGRNQGNAGGFSGPGVNRSTGETSRTASGGVRKVRARKSKRWNGRTRGKGTATKAHVVIEKKAPDIVAKQIDRAIRKTFS